MVEGTAAALVGPPYPGDAFRKPFRACTPPSAPWSSVDRTQPRARPSLSPIYLRPGNNSALKEVTEPCFAPKWLKLTDFINLNPVKCLHVRTVPFFLPHHFWTVHPTPFVA